MTDKGTKKGLFVPRNPAKYAGNAKQIVYRSSWEHFLMERFDMSDYIVSWASEEIKIAYVSHIDNEFHYYFPDFMIRQKNKEGVLENILIEVKPIHEILKPIKKARQSAEAWNKAAAKWAVNVKKWLAAMQWCKKNDTRFLLVTKNKDGWGGFQYINESKLEKILTG
jgi:hypothetical protein